MRIPDVVNLELTNRCNLGCVFCDHSTLRKIMRIGDLDEGLLVSILKSLADFDIYELGLVGLGEPLLNANLERHLKITAKYNNGFKRISLNSNGTLMNPRMTEIILNSPINLITFSLNATNRESYMKLMRTDMFDVTVKNIKHFISERNRAGRRDMNISIQLMSSCLNSDEELRRIFEGYMDDNIIVYRRYVFNKPSIEKSVEKFVDVNEVNSARRYPCWSIYSRVYIDIDGNVYPCTIGNDCYRGSSKLYIGNVKEHTLPEIFNNEYMEKARSRAENNKIPFAECEDCTLWELLPNNFEFIDDKWVYGERDKVRRLELDRKD